MVGNLFNLKQLEALVWIADLGSFRKAAQHLNTTQPNISSRIAGLEQGLGVVLMQRDAGSVRMTEQGRAILEQARRVLREAETLVETAQRSDLIEDRLRLGVTELIASTWLPDYLRRLKEAYPGVAVELTVDLSRNLDEGLEQNTLDLAVQNAPFGTKAAGEIALGRFPYVWVAEAGIAAALPGRCGVADLIPHSIITHARHTQAYDELAAYAAAKGLATARIVPCNSLSFCPQMALDGLGVALLPKALVERSDAGARLVVLDVDWLPSALRFAARFHKGRASGLVERAAGIAEDVAQRFGV